MPTTKYQLNIHVQIWRTQAYSRKTLYESSKIYVEHASAKSESLKKILVKILFSYIVNKIDKSS